MGGGEGKGAVKDVNLALSRRQGGIPLCSAVVQFRGGRQPCLRSFSEDANGEHRQPRSPCGPVARHIAVTCHSGARLARRRALMPMARSARHRKVRLQDLLIPSPKRSRKQRSGWEGFFPYYAGYPETFASTVLASARLPAGSAVLDPWNGSGTTTVAASRLGLVAYGWDLNPVMVVVARARLLPATEADHLTPLSIAVASRSGELISPLRDSDPLLDWFEPATAAEVRSLERSIGRTLLGESAAHETEVRLDQISGTAATFYVALFSACRRLVQRFQSSNPTWLRRARPDEQKISVTRRELAAIFKENVAAMADTLSKSADHPKLFEYKANIDVILADTSQKTPEPDSLDFVLTSPPYCTRIDYTAATRIELAVLDPLVSTSIGELGRKMIGSIKVPNHKIEPSNDWGPTCIRFLERLRAHQSKASSGYYYKIHLDYFEKITASIANISVGLRSSCIAIMVVQDSHYKEIHNDLPTIIGEIAKKTGLTLRRKEDFHLKRSMAGIHPHARSYGRPIGALESVLCFQKE